VLTTRLMATLGLNAVFALAAFWVGHRLLRRDASGDGGRALRLFALWWLGFGADTLINALTWLAGGVGAATPLVTSVLTYLALASIVLMTWGLTYYLVYLVTGRSGAFWPIAAFYAVSLVLMTALIAYLEPVGVTMHAWAGEIAYARKPPAIAEFLVALYFLLPPLAGALTYGTVALRVQGRAERYRILAVAAGIFVWFTSALFLTGSGAGGTDPGNLAGKAIGVVCMGLIVSVYATPAWLARWLHAPGAPLEHVDPRTVRAQRRERRREALGERVRDLV
jgi:hypothetical protein